MHDARRTLLTVIFAAILLPGCKRAEDIVSYNAPKPPEQRAVTTQEAVATASAMTLPAPEIPGVSYTMPTGWKPEPAHTFEAARFDPGAGDGKTVFSVSTLGPGFDFPGNVERWQKQVGTAQNGSEPGKATTVSGIQAKTFDLKGAAEQAYIVVVPRQDATWIFKLMGPADKVQTAKPLAEAFVQSVKFGEASSPTAAAPTPPEQPPIAATATPSADAMPMAFTAPSDWQSDPQPRPMRLATWTAGSGDAKAEIYITDPIPASMFDIPSNVNRWRNQVGLPPDANISANPTSDIKIGDKRGVEIDLTGPAKDGNPAKRLVVAFAGEKNLWFFKIVGPADAVAKQKPEFEKFLASVKFKPDAQ